MGEIDNNNQREEIFSKAVRAGKRTYFIDVKATKAGEQYITITESKRRFNEEGGNFFYEKHKLFLYKEDFEKFAHGLDQVIHFVETGEKPAEEEIHLDESVPKDNAESNDILGIDFDKIASDNQ